jgi:hypothetical protein
MPLAQQLLVLEVVGEPAVAAVDDEVALGEEVAELGDGLRVISPAATIVQTTRGASRDSTSASSVGTSETAGLMS